MKILKSLLLNNILLALIIFFTALPVHAETSKGEEPENYVSVRLISDKADVVAGDAIRIGIEQTIYPKWHTYWKNPGDSGTATDIEWDLPPGFIVSDLEWPTPKKLPFGPLTNYGYEGTVTLLQTLKLPDAIPPGPFMLNGTVNLLVCHDICIPESHDVAIVFNGGRLAETYLVANAEKALPTLKDWTASYSESNGNFVIDVKTNDKSILKSQEVILAPEDWGAVDNTVDVSFEETEGGFQLFQKRGERDLNQFKTLPIVIGYDGDGIRLEATPASNDLVVGVLPTGGNSTLLLQALLFAFLGGLILNLMPCVFPVLSLKALSLIKLNEQEEKKAKQYGLSYTAGILVSFSLIAAVLLGLKASGEQIGWGFQLQNPIVITVLIYLIFLVGLNLSGFFEFSSKFTNIGQGLTQKPGHKGAFFTGVLATIVATPCTAPFMGTAMGFALTQPAITSLLIFLMLGFGLAFPYLLLCYVPALRSKLPKPGAWMETFRQFLAFPMFITATWLVWVLSQQVSSIGVLCALLGLVALAIIIWLTKVWPKNAIGKIFAGILMGVAIIFASLPVVFPGATATQIEQEESDNWEMFTPALLEEKLSGNDPVFVNMTAAWCITCKVNERVALNTEEARKLFAEKNIQYLKGDWTNKDATITDYLDSFDRSGVPIYVYYGPRDAQSGLRPDAKVLPQILTFGIVEKALQ
jgi:thiol:disulfide interchange protein DsbD